MSENNKFAYKFTNKQTGKFKFGLLHTAGEGFLLFRTTDGEDIRIENPNQDFAIKENDTYFVVLEENYEGPLPTWDN